LNHNLIGAIVAAIAGVVIALINYIFSKKVLINAPEKYSLITVVRQILQVGFLVVVYFTGTKTQLADPVYLLIGAVLGMTVPMIYFTKKLLLINEAEAKAKNKKEDEADG
jgi:hypothetical protein